MTTRQWFRIHSFTGVITGMLLFVICWSGTFAVISNELDWLVTPEARLSEPVLHSQLDWPAMTSAVQQQHPDAHISSAYAPRYSRGAAEFIVNLPDQDFVRVYVDPNDNVVTGHYSYVNMQRFFRDFHRYLYLPTIGFYLVMSFAITLSISLVASLYVYRRWWTRFFRFRPGKKAFWSELHKTAGLWNIWFMAIMCITGFWYLFEGLRADLGDGVVTYFAYGDFAGHQLPPVQPPEGTHPKPLAELLEIAVSVRPDIEIRSIAFDWYPHVLYIDGQSSHWLVRDRANQLMLNQYTGDVVYNQHADQYPLYWRWSDTADPLHFGDFGGLLSKAVWFVFGLALSTVILTGTWLHAQRLLRDETSKSRHVWPGTVTAMLVSIGVLAAALPFALAESYQYYGPVVDGVRTLPALAPGVKATMIGWIGISCFVLLAWMGLLIKAIYPDLFKRRTGSLAVQETS